MPKAKRGSATVGCNVFVSWSKARSKGPAKAFADWLGVVVQLARPWISTKDVPAGSPWFSKITAALEHCNFGVVFVTRENMREPWLHFEAGAVLKAVSNEARVCPVVLDFDLTDLEDPFASLNAVRPDREGMLRLALEINAAIDSGVGEDQVKVAFDGQWANLEQKLTLPPGKAATARHQRDDRELLEEILLRVRALERESNKVVGHGFRERLQERYFLRQKELLDALEADAATSEVTIIKK
jgi:hypothetical protein